FYCLTFIKSSLLSLKMKATVTVFLFLSLFGQSFSLYRKHILVTEKMTWNNAQKYCREYHDDLSTINKEEAHLLSINPEVNDEYFWTGLHMISNSLEKWSCGNFLQYKAWSAEGEPQCPARNLRCGALDRKRNIWQPKDCEEKLNFVCLKKP
uniref:C-type lectin domain-containing protein n=1 Tax=Cyprinus carpio carpio TaxID=630221 RepID=A0A9J8CRY4_CYPCA